MAESSRVVVQAQCAHLSPAHKLTRVVVQRQSRGAGAAANGLKRQQQAGGGVMPGLTLLQRCKCAAPAQVAVAGGARGKKHVE